MWPKENFIELCNKLQDYKLVFIGSKEEENIINDIINNLSSKKDIINTSGKLNLSQLFALVDKLDILITNDNDLISRINGVDDDLKSMIKVYSDSKDPLDVMSTVCEAKPALAIIDDDFLAPDTVHIMKSIRKVNKGLDIIFCTSNTSIDLGKKVSQLGIQYYAIKPLTEGELQESLKAVLKDQQRKTLSI